jgi:hypothetical protein
MPMAPLFMRREPARSRKPFERFDPPVREGSGQREIDRDPKMQELMIKLKLMGRGRLYPRRANPDDGDIVGYLDEKCTQPLVRFHWWEMPPSERRNLMKRSFLWVSYWDPIEKRREIIWLPTTLKGE